MGSTTTAPAPPLTAHLTATPRSGMAAMPEKGIHLGRERVKWSEEVWDRIDRAVHHEFQRTSVSARFLPHHRVDPHVTTVPADTILDRINGQPLNVPAILLARAVPPAPPNPLLLNIDEAATTRLVEIWVEFSLTPQQVEQESKFKHVVLSHTDQSAHTGAPGYSDHQAGPGHNEHLSPQGHPRQHKHHPRSTAVTLATRAANVLSQAVDSVVFQGQIATAGPLVNSGLVGNRGNPVDFGLLCVGPAGPQNLPAGQVVAVPQGPLAAGAVSYAENTVRAIGDAYSQLQQGGHYGPYACVLFF